MRTRVTNQSLEVVYSASTRVTLDSKFVYKHNVCVILSLLSPFTLTLYSIAPYFIQVTISVSHCLLQS